MTNNHKLKIGLDYHGLIDINAIYFSNFCSEAKLRGHLVYIITGGPKVLVENLLFQNNIEHDFVYAISDYYQALGIVEQTPNGNICIPTSLWNRAKAKFCRENDISIHIDDDKQYLQWFSTLYAHYDKAENIAVMPTGIKFNFNEDPKTVLAKMEQLFN